mmetsp:Transcript_10640/g.15018  ORF Transcript_10640/g.15018 Transcript_10640/m.15018 type:complete len:190 (-) Transcript_10640:91-660(-)
MSKLAKLKESATTGLIKAGSVLGIESKASEDSTASAVDELAEMCPKLSFQQRIIGFASCFSIGYLITFLSFKFFIELMEGNAIPFVVVYSVGNILSLLSSMFLSGPRRHFKNLFDEKRRCTSITFLTSLALSIGICFIPMEHKLKLSLLILLLLIQFCANLWYNLSYIPFGRRTVKNFLKRLIGLDERT